MVASLLGCTLIGSTLTSCGSSSESTTVFELIVENIAPRGTITGAFGEPQDIAFSIGLGAVSTLAAPIYTIGEPARANGLEKFAEDADPSDLVEGVQSTQGVTVVLLATSPRETETGGGALLPGQSYRVVFNAESAESRLSFAVPYFQANDIIVGTGNDGVPLFNADGTARSGDITSDFQFLDVGTEVNEAPGQGPNQVIRQPKENTGTSENNPVAAPNDGFSYPAVNATLRVTINPIQSLD